MDFITVLDTIHYQANLMRKNNFIPRKVVMSPEMKNRMRNESRFLLDVYCCDGDREEVMGLAIETRSDAPPDLIYVTTEEYGLVV